MTRTIDQWPPIDDIMDALDQDEDVGWCTACGAESNVEQDTDAGLCDDCGRRRVYGAMTLLMRIDEDTFNKDAHK